MRRIHHVGTDFPYVDFIPTQPKIVQIDSDPTHLGRRAPRELRALRPRRRYPGCAASAHPNRAAKIGYFWMKSLLVTRLLWST